jgi:hypothetical protein
MRKRISYWIEFFAPGPFVAETWQVDCPADTKPERVVFPDSAYAFKLWKREDRVEGDKLFRGDPEQIGPTYYHPDSKVETLQMVESHPRGNEILISNMKCNKWDSVIWTRWRNWPQPFNSKTMQIIAG